MLSVGLDFAHIPLPDKFRLIDCLQFYTSPPQWSWPFNSFLFKLHGVRERYDWKGIHDVCMCIFEVHWVGFYIPS